MVRARVRLLPLITAQLVCAVYASGLLASIPSASAARPLSGPPPPKVIPVESQPKAQPHPYQGAFWGLGVHTGLVYRLNARSGDLPGPTVALSARIASILSLADFQLTAQGSTYTATSSLGEPVDVRRLSVGVQAHLHPLFLQHLENSNFWFWAAGIYVSLGMSIEVTEFASDPAAKVEIDPGWTLGAGMDYPLTDVHAGWSLWLGVAYHVRFLGVSSGISGLGNFNEHNVLVTLGYRNNDVFLFRAPRPTELDYRNPKP